MNKEHKGDFVFFKKTKLYSNYPRTLHAEEWERNPLTNKLGKCSGESILA